MTKEEFLSKHSDAYSSFLKTDFANDLFDYLLSLRPNPHISMYEHHSIQLLGQIDGYELCLRNAKSVLTKPKPRTSLEANYGVDANEVKK